MKKLFLITFLFAMVFNAYSQTNVINNGGFEYGTVGWNVWGASLSTTTDSHSGTLAASVSNRKNLWDGLVRDVTNLLINGQTYTLSAWVKIANPAVNFRATLALNVNGITTYTAYFWTSSPVIGSYVFYQQNITPTWAGNLTSATINFEAESVNNIYSDLIVDDVKLEGTAIDNLVITKGLKDIKSTMSVGGTVGGFSNDGTQNYFTSTKYKSLVLSDCRTVTVQCYPAWGRWDENQKYIYHLEAFNNQVKELKNQKLNVIAHMLLGWDFYFPDWYQNNDFPADTLETMMNKWIQGIIKYEGNDTLVDTWNVVNEAISWDGKGGYWPESNSDHINACKLQKMGYESDASGLAGNMYVNAEHPVYIRKAFEYARTFTNKKLELRDAPIEFPTDSKYNAFYQLAVHLKNMAAPVDVIGFQTHLNLESVYDWDGYINNIKRYQLLGYEVYIDEVDIGDIDKSWSNEKADLQKMMYYRLVTSAIKGGANVFQTWGFNDGNNANWRSGENALPYNNDFSPKPAYYGIKEALTDMSHILFWEMDAPENNIMPDVMRYNNFGTMHNFGTSSIVTGFKSKAIQFDGVNDYISTGLLSDTISGDLTFSSFIKTSTTSAGIIADIAQNGSSGLKIGINANGKLYLNADEAGLSANLVSSASINDSTWHFVALRRDNLTYYLYVDAVTPVASGIGSIQKFTKLVIGAKSDGTTAFEGIVDEVKLYNSAIEEASFTRNMVPYGPLNLKITQNNRIMTLSWVNQSNNEAGFIIERKTADGAWEEHTNVDAKNLTLSDTVELYNTEYAYRVRAFNKFGKSVYSNSIIVKSPQDETTGIFEKNSSSSDFKNFLYPNPVNNTFTIVTRVNSSMKIFDISGRKMLEKSNLSGKDIININQFNNGVYIVQIHDGESICELKLIKN